MSSRDWLALMAKKASSVPCRGPTPRAQCCRRTPDKRCCVGPACSPSEGCRPRAEGTNDRLEQGTAWVCCVTAGRLVCSSQGGNRAQAGLSLNITQVGPQHSRQQLHTPDLPSQVLRRAWPSWHTQGLMLAHSRRAQELSGLPSDGGQQHDLNQRLCRLMQCSERTGNTARRMRTPPLMPASGKSSTSASPGGRPAQLTYGDPLKRLTTVCSPEATGCYGS